MAETAFVLTSGCPMCGYDLQGLPEGHVCPECAFPVEREGLLCRGRRRGAVFVWAAGFILLINGVALFADARGNDAGAIVAAIGLTLIILQVIRLARPARPNVGVSPGGLTLFPHGGAWRQYAWTEVGSAQLSFLDGFVEISACNGAVLFRKRYEELGSWAKAKELVAIVEQRARKADVATEGSGA